MATKTKEERYDWITIDEPGELVWIEKDLLLIDHKYQRDMVTRSRVLHIAGEWSWVACGALIVARREDGSLWVIDGQHRKLAADKRSDITRLPCIVFASESQRQEAKGFVQANTVRGPVDSMSKYKAMIVAKDPIALLVQDVAGKYGYAISGNSSRGTIACVAALLKSARLDHAAFESAFCTSTKLYRGRTIPAKVFDALFYIERLLRRTMQSSFDDQCILSRLLKYSPEEIEANIRSRQAKVGQGGSTIHADEIIRMMNHKRHGRNRIPQPIR